MVHLLHRLYGVDAPDCNAQLKPHLFALYGSILHIRGVTYLFMNLFMNLALSYMHA